MITKHIEVSRRFKLTREITQDELKKSLLDSLGRAIHVDTTQDAGEAVRVIGTTGGGGFMGRHARVDLNVRVVKHQETARIMLNGTASMARSLFLGYIGIVLLVLLVGLLPGSIETNGIDSNAMDTLVLMLFGIFIFYDISKKVSEPAHFLDSLLQSLETEFG